MAKALPVVGALLIKVDNEPAFFALDNLVAAFIAIPPGTPNCVRIDVTFPVQLSSAKSSSLLKIASLSKYSSTSRVILVPNPKSARVVPSDITPSTALIAPEGTPATADTTGVYQDLLSFFSSSTLGIVLTSFLKDSGNIKLDFFLISSSSSSLNLLGKIKSTIAYFSGVN